MLGYRSELAAKKSCILVGLAILIYNHNLFRADQRACDFACTVLRSLQFAHTNHIIPTLSPIIFGWRLRFAQIFSFSVFCFLLRAYSSTAHGHYNLTRQNIPGGLFELHMSSPNTDFLCVCAFLISSHHAPWHWQDIRGHLCGICSIQLHNSLFTCRKLWADVRGLLAERWMSKDCELGKCQNRSVLRKKKVSAENPSPQLVCYVSWFHVDKISSILVHIRSAVMVIDDDFKLRVELTVQGNIFSPVAAMQLQIWIQETVAQILLVETALVYFANTIFWATSSKFLPRRSSNDVPRSISYWFQTFNTVCTSPLSAGFPQIQFSLLVAKPVLTAVLIHRIGIYEQPSD